MAALRQIAFYGKRGIGNSKRKPELVTASLEDRSLGFPSKNEMHLHSGMSWRACAAATASAAASRTAMQRKLEGQPPMPKKALILLAASYDIVRHLCRLLDTDCSFNHAANLRPNYLKGLHHLYFCHSCGLARLLHDQPWESIPKNRNGPNEEGNNMAARKKRAFSVNPRNRCAPREN
ncbi:hypothetical protein [Sinorhizobium meliloti]|uniref:hypothetical protein n=1 Tax=Rhizobium meliloti TaxID=382 RepID=UPI000A6447D8|nr:hypothetical protein [Sinorhizobium meliloti]